MADEPQYDDNGELIVKSPQSPTKVARSKAAEGARKAAEAAAAAERLMSSTRHHILASSLNATKLPCAVVSPGTEAAEELKAAPPDAVQPSPFVPLPRLPSAGLPTGGKAGSQEQFDDLLASKLRAIVHHEPLSLEGAEMIGAALRNPQCAVEFIDLRRALDTAFAPPPPKARVDALAAQIEAEVGPEDIPENVEKLQAMVEKAKGEFTTYEKALRFLAERRLDRFDALVEALLRGFTLTSLSLAQNRLGAPNAEGQASYRELRKVARILDETNTIQTLDLSGNLMGPTGVGIVAKGLSKNITVTAIDLSGNEICVEAPDEIDDPDKEEEDPVFGELYQGLEAIAEVLKKNKFLKVLSLRQNRIKAEIDEQGEEDGVETPLGKFLEPFKRFHRLEVLDLSRNELGPAGAKMLANALLANRSVRTLDISDNGIGVVGLGHIARLVAGNHTLSELVLRKNDIVVKPGSKRAHKQAVEVFQQFTQAVASSASLRSLNLSDHHWGPEFSEMILRGVPESRIQVLHVANNDLCGTPETGFSPAALQHIVAAAKRPGEPFAELHIAANHIGPQGAALLGEVLASIRVVDISRNVLTDEGAKHLLAAVVTGEVWCMMQSLDLSFNDLSDAAILAAVVARAGTLHTLTLASNRLGVTTTDGRNGVEVLADAICRGGPLRSLSLACNDLEASSVAGLVRIAAESSAPFAVLDVNGNPGITLGDAQRILAALKHNPSIAVVRISSQHGDRTPIMDTVFDVLQFNTKLVDVDLCLPVDTRDDLIAVMQRALLKNSLGGFDASAGGIGAL